MFGVKVARRRSALGLLLGLVLVFLQPMSAHAASPGQNGKIAFQRSGDIYTAAADGSSIKRLTTTRNNSWPAWSPDGKKIAFTRAMWIWTMNADGSGQQRRWPGVGPTWSPDGKSLAYFTSNIGDDCGSPGYVRRSFASPSKVYVLYSDEFNCSGGDPGYTVYAPAPSWSPDGTRVLAGLQLFYYADAFNGVGDGGGQLQILELAPPGWLVTTNSYNDRYTTAVQVTRAPKAKAPITPDVDYSPTNLQNLAFTSDIGFLDGKGRLWVYNRAGTYKHQASPDLYASQPAYSPDGKQLLYTQHVPGQPWKIRRVTLPSSTPTTVITNGSQADWQPTP